VSFKQIHDTQLAITVKIDKLEQLLNEFYKLVEKLVDENAATNIIHKELMTVVRASADFMSQVPNLLNTLIDMLTEERITLKDGWTEIEEIKDRVNSMYEFIETNRDKMTKEVNKDEQDTPRS